MRPAHKPTEETRARVRKLAAIGVPQDTISKQLRIGPKTLRKHYGADLDAGELEANEAVAGALYRQAQEGNTVAAIFWAKTRMRWCEARPEVWTEAEMRLIRTMRELRVSSADVEAILRVMALPPEQRGAALAVQARARELTGGKVTD